MSHFTAKRPQVRSASFSVGRFVRPSAELSLRAHAGACDSAHNESVAHQSVARGTVERAARLPWLTHLVAAVVMFLWVLWRQVRQYGLTSTDPYPLGLMSYGILVAAWLLAAPAVCVELWAAGSDRWRWFARGAACVATAILVWFGTLPVGLRFFASSSPVSNADMRSAVINYLVLLAGYLLLLLLGVLLQACVAGLRGISGRDGSRRA